MSYIEKARDVARFARLIEEVYDRWADKMEKGSVPNIAYTVPYESSAEEKHLDTMNIDKVLESLQKLHAWSDATEGMADVDPRWADARARASEG